MNPTNRHPRPNAPAQQPAYLRQDPHSLARVGVRELRQNLSVYLRRVEEGETLEVTDHGQPVARLTPLPPAQMSVLDRLIAEGKATPGKGGNIADWKPIDIGPGPTLSEVLQQMRDEDDR